MPAGLRRLVLVAAIWCLTTGAVVRCSSGSDELLEPQNRAPVAADADFEATAGASVTGLLQATDPDGDRVSFRIVTGPAPGALTAFDGALGRFTFLPGGVGTDSFSFVASDGRKESAVATVRITIVATAGKPAVDAAAAARGPGTSPGTPAGVAAADPFAQGRRLAVAGNDGLEVLEHAEGLPGWTPLARPGLGAGGVPVLAFDGEVPGRVGLAAEDGGRVFLAVSGDGGRKWPMLLDLGPGRLEQAGCPQGRVCMARDGARYAWPLPGW